MYRFYAEKVRECRGEGEITLFKVKTTVVFTLSWAGDTPLPSKKKRMLYGVYPEYS